MSLKRRVEQLEKHSSLLPPSKRVFLYENDKQFEEELQNILKTDEIEGDKPLIVITGINRDGCYLGKTKDLS